MKKFSLMSQTNELLKAGGFEYAVGGGQAIDLFLGYESRTHGDIDIIAFWKDRDMIIQFMQSQGFYVYEMLGGGRAHRITDLSKQMYLKRNICCFREGCPLVKVYPLDADGCGRFEFFHVGQTELDFVEFLFNDKSETHFEYARNREIKRELGKAILFSGGVPYLCPEMCLLYKSTYTEREGYRQDFELACGAMNAEQRDWLEDALFKQNPQGHKWLSYMRRKSDA